jgi:hypothetical protein
MEKLSCSVAAACYSLEEYCRLGHDIVQSATSSPTLRSNVLPVTPESKNEIEHILNVDFSSLKINVVLSSETSVPSIRLLGVTFTKYRCENHKTSILHFCSGIKYSTKTEVLCNYAIKG